MPLPDSQTLLLPVLRMIADGTEHTVEEMREHIVNEFEITDDEQAQKQRNGIPVYHNRVAWALAWLNMGKAITLRRNGVYQIAEHGRAILKGNPSDLSVKDVLESEKR